MEETATNTLRHFGDVYHRRKRLIFIPFIIFAPLIFTVFTFVPRTYRSSTTILVEAQKVSEDYVRATVSTSMEDRLRTISQQVMSVSRLRKVLQRLKIINDMSDLKLINELITFMQKKIEVKTEKGRLFSISFTGSNPMIVTKITNQIASIFIEENLKLSEQQAASTTEFLSSELENVKHQLEAQEDKLRLYKQRYMRELPEQLDANLRTLDRLQVQLQTTQGFLKDVQSQIITVEQQVSMERENILSSLAGDVSLRQVNQEDNQLQTLQKKLSSLQERYSDSWPKIKRLKAEIAKIKKVEAKESPPGEKNTKKTASSSLLETLNINFKSLKRRETGLQTDKIQLIKELRKYEILVENAPKREAELSSLTRDTEILRTRYQSLLDKKLDAKLSESLTRKQKGENFIILDAAEAPLEPFFPKFKHIILGSLGGGIMMSLLFVYYKEFLNDSYQSLEEITQSLGLPVIGIIPRIITKKQKVKRFFGNVLVSIVLLAYLGAMGIVCLNKQPVNKRLKDWGLIPSKSLI